MPERKENDRAQLNVRMRESLRANLAKAAAGKGVSLNAEVVSRLERSRTAEAWEKSFNRAAEQERVEELLGGPEIFGLLMIVGRAMKEAGQVAEMMAPGASAGETWRKVLAKRGMLKKNAWMTNPYAFNQAVKTANAVFEALRPPGEIKPPEVEYPGYVGLGYADRALSAVHDPEGELDDERQRWGSEVRKRLGPAAEQLYAVEIAQTCAIAGRPELAAEFIARRSSPAQVRDALLRARATEENDG